MAYFNIVAATTESTVVAEYEPKATRSDAYQSEAELERELIRVLTTQGYEYLSIHTEGDLVKNLRTQLEKLNDYVFTDSEWEQFFADCIANNNEGIVEKTRKIQSDHIQTLHRDNGMTKNISLIDKKNIHNNFLQVINQYEVGIEDGANHDNRYDVTVLVNGLPLIHIELKRRGVAIREAFNQIKRYQRDSFWAGHGLFEYVQIFVISNGTHTKYYSNTTRNSHIKEMDESGRRKSKKTSNSFEFTSFWADGKNKVIPDLIDFTKTFFAKHTILNVLTRYCVFTSEDVLMVMRPYQIAATERILNRIEVSTTYKKVGTIEAGGYIWHTTGSGKTLTSFKTAQLASQFSYIDKVLFVVDRKDLDYQTMKEYDRFEKGAANGNASTAILKRQLEDTDAKIIITTIQKLDHFVTKNKGHTVFEKHCVIIFDECHRSQFGDMHKKITKAFKNYHLFGFTGTPIFSKNAVRGKHAELLTTPQAFGGEADKDGRPTLPLHAYTIVNAINDENVLPFRIDYVDTVKKKENIKDKNVKAIDIERVMGAPERIKEVSEYILEHFDQKTRRNSYYSLKGKRMAGFNSIFAVSSIPMAMKYYTEIKRLLAEQRRQLTVATIFSYSANEEDPDDVLGEEGFDTEALDQTSRDFLESAIKDYNEAFHTNFDTSADKFQNYYKDLSMRVKNREVDLLIVVNMFLTGFDATTLNTLWVDKNLKMHGLIQAYSRTNRILNSVKTYGNIICFRDLQQATDDALALFGDENAGGIVLLKSFEDYYHGFEDANGRYHPGYIDLLERLDAEFPLGQEIIGERAEKEFIKLFSAILSLRNILASFDKFGDVENMSERDLQDYQSIYIDLYDKYRNRDDGDKENINDDIVFEIELIKQVEVNIDYILMLVEKYHDGNCEDKEILATIQKAVDASLQLRSKKELIEQFISRVNVETSVQSDWRRYVSEQEEADLTEIISTENLKPDETRKFIENAFRDGAVKTTGTDIDKLMPPVSRFGGGNRAEKKQGVIDKLKAFFEKYFGII
ncbi:type I restriction endonuclease subunit R [Vermiculatibacterium agrestimuris]|jgi:type I restriction enzyme R subunit|uniref:type I restriction endonuclease subunit R n=1 Tax=Vermiculatibacterium agrestimuris TaxID=2941519 RepID=UPI00203A50B4|nr:type I restriction endonuclease subunit R [Vermiculatibacterium agrestimuris]